MLINFYSYNSYPSYNINLNSPNFGAKGQPISLQYIMQHHQKFLPKRVKEFVQELLAKDRNSQRSLLDVHKEIYEPILGCKTMEALKLAYPEFDGVLPSVPIKRPSVNSAGRTTENFGLRVLQEYWGRLKTKDEIAQELGMKNRTSLDFSLKKINFIGFNTNYKTLLKASDTAGNLEIANKTKAWNRANPETRRELNKHAAQSCKKDEYRQAQSERMKQREIDNPELREQINEHLRLTWNTDPKKLAQRQAMSDFARGQDIYTGHVLSKAIQKEELSPIEKRLKLIYYKKFWETHPEFKKDKPDK